jgi:tetratricopeptide (TPR) repeat protein
MFFNLKIEIEILFICVYVGIVDYFVNVLAMTIRPNAESYEILLTALMELQNTDELTKYYNEMLTAGFDTSPSLLKKMFRYYYKVNAFPKVVESFDALIKRDIPQDILSVNQSLHASLQINNLEATKAILTYAREKNIPFTMNTYFMEFVFHLKTNNIVKAENLLQTLKEWNGEVEERFYIALIDYYITQRNCAKIYNITHNATCLRKEREREAECDI